MKKYLKWVGIAILTPILLIILLTVALYLPPVQNWAVGIVSDIASEKTGMNIKVGHVCLVFPLDLGVDDVLVTQQNDSLPQVTDTIAGIERAVVDVQLWPLFDGNVEVDRLDLYGMKVNTSDFVSQARVKGSLGTLSLESHGIHLNEETVRLDKAYLADAKLDIALSDTVPEDTTESENFWKISLVDLNVERTDIKLHMPGDTLQLGAHVGKLAAKEGFFDLGKQLYQIAALNLKDGRATFDNVYEPKSSLLSTAQGGLDINHLAFSGINIGIDSLFFCDNDLKLKIRNGELVEKCGIGVASLVADIAMDSTQVRLITDAATRNVNNNPSSKLSAKMVMDLNVLDSLHPGIVDADIDASLSKADLMLAMGDLPEAFRNGWPASPLTIKALAKGNMQKVDISKLEAALPSAFRIEGKGYAINPTDIGNLKAKLHLDASTYDLNFAKSMLDRDMQKMIALPAMHAIADVTANGSNYDVDFNVSEGKGNVKGKGSINTKVMAYDASLNVHNLQLNHFVKGMGLGVFSGKADVNGRGTDFLSPSTSLRAKAKVDEFQFDKWDLKDIDLEAGLLNGKGFATMDSHNELIDGKMALEALTNKNMVKATFTTELNRADLYNLSIADAPLTVSACAHIDLASDLDEYYMMQGLISDLTIVDTIKAYRPDDMVLDVLTRRDTTHAVVDCGDFHLNADMQGGYKKLMNVVNNITDEINRQWESRTIDEQELRKSLPLGHIYLSASNENPIARSLTHFDITYGNIFVNLSSSPVDGLNGKMRLDTLCVQGMQLDHIRMNLESDEKDMHYEASIENEKGNPQYSFRANAKGKVVDNGTTLWCSVDDYENKRIAELSIAAKMDIGGIRMMFDDNKQILGYTDFKVNDDNYIFFADDMRLSANLMMNGADGTGIQVYTDDENIDALQDITISLQKFDIKKILSALPYMPDVSGIMNGDFHAIITPENLSVSSDVAFNNLIYEKSPIGNISSEFVYMPKEDGSHYIDGLLFKDSEEVGSIIGTYYPEGEGKIDAMLSMQNFPLNIANGFIPDQIIGIEGKGEGELSITGSLTNPIINGELFTREASLKSVPYGVSMRFDDTPVKISNSHLTLDNFRMYANNDQPLVCNGYIDFADTEHIMTNLRMNATNFQIIDAKETRRSEAYGKAFVNFNATMRGELDRLAVRGQLNVLSTTDLYYILKDSPITTDNRLKELVTFTDLSVDEPVAVQRPTVDGMDIQMNISVADGSHVKCWLNANHTNYVDIYAGGDLFATYKGGDINVTGRCTISEGEMKYSLPIIPLKTFTIADGSYIEFTGDMMNPRLNITATEENKTNVNIDGVSQTVMFDCGVVISKTLNDMGLEFIIDAPENQTISDELKTKSIEERGKLAVTMLTTGMYLTEDNTSSFTMNSALSSFLQSEINQIAGSALRTLDLSVGLENSIDEMGQSHMDYSFKFAKRFWNNRLSISVGGKISTGPEVSGQNSSFFDNVEVQYRLSDTSNQYLQLFYKRAVYDYLEGYIGQYGAGYMYKRKLQSLKELIPAFLRKDEGEERSGANEE